MFPESPRFPYTHLYIDILMDVLFLDYTYIDILRDKFYIYTPKQIRTTKNNTEHMYTYT